MLRVVVSLLAAFAISPSGGLAKEPAKLSKFPRVIAGTITDLERKPIEGARVEYGYFSAEEDDREIALSDAKGRYQLVVRNAGRDHRVGVSAEGYAPQFLDGFLPGPMDNPKDFSVQLPPGSQLSLRIVSRSGQPASNLQLRPTTPSTGFISSFSSPIPPTPFPGNNRTMRTDADGRVVLKDLPARPASPYAADVPKEKRRATAWIGLELSRRDNRGWNQHQITIEDVAKAVAGQPVTLTVADHVVQAETNDGVIKGRVVDKQTGDPIRDFVVVRRYTTEAEAFHDDQGRFSSGGDLRRGRAYQTRIFKPGYAVAVGRATANAESEVQEQVFELEKHPSFRGRIIDSDGQPVAGIELVSGYVQVNRSRHVEWSTLDSYADGYHSFENVLRIKTNELGEFVIPEVPEHPATLLIMAPRHARQVIPPAKRPGADKNGSVSIVLKKEASLVAIADRTTQLGARADRVGLSFRSADGFDHMYHSGQVDDDGKKVYRSMAPGEYTVSLYLQQGSFSYPTYSKTVMLTAGEETTVELGEMFGALTLSGLASPFSTVTVHATVRLDGPKYFAVHADVDGEFELRGLLSGEYTVRTDNSSSSSGYHGRGRPKQIKLEEDTYMDLRSPTRQLKTAR